MTDCEPSDSKRPKLDRADSRVVYDAGLVGVRCAFVERVRFGDLVRL